MNNSKNDFRTSMSLCWDCAKATGYCRWSSSLKPVKGWKIIPTKRLLYGGEYTSCIVLECPEFVRDAYQNGSKRYKGDETDEAK